MQPEDPEREDLDAKVRSSRWAILRSVSAAIISLVVVVGCAVIALALVHPESPLPRNWNPTAPLVATDPVTPLTSWKLRRTLNDPQLCLSALEGAAQIARLDPFEASMNCHIRNRVLVSGLQTARIDRVETSCATALRLVLWEIHGVQPAAREILGTQVTGLRQIGSYNCRPIRTTQGESTRWSTHSTADAIDITGFDLADGHNLRLIADWSGRSKEAEFLRAVRDSACSWFATTLGPDYNALHADHLHLQARGWGACR